MLQIKIEDSEVYDEHTGQFIQIKGQVLQLEHSLVSMSKWESKWHKPFLSPDKKSPEETIDYIRCMTITQNVNPAVYLVITPSQVAEVNRYISDPMSAKVFRKEEGKGSVYRTVTSEDIYYSIVAYQIPFECQKWHFNRLMTLIRICDEHNKPDKKKMRPSEYADMRRKLNQSRKAKRGMRG